MDDIDLEVKKILERDIEFQFKITSTEIDACETRMDMEKMVDIYMDGVKTVIKSRIINKNPRLK